MPYKSVEQQREYQRQWKAERRARYLDGKTCVQCGSDQGLQFDHIDPNQKIDHRIWSWAIPRIEAELAKCQVLCQPCHRGKTNAQNYPPRQHGTYTSYSKGCHCDACKGAKNRYQRAYRAA